MSQQVAQQVSSIFTELAYEEQGDQIGEEFFRLLLFYYLPQHLKSSNELPLLRWNVLHFYIIFVLDYLVSVGQLFLILEILPLFVGLCVYYNLQISGFNL